MERKATTKIASTCQVWATPRMTRTAVPKVKLLLLELLRSSSLISPKEKGGLLSKLMWAGSAEEPSSNLSAGIFQGSYHSPSLNTSHHPPGMAFPSHSSLGTDEITFFKNKYMSCAGYVAGISPTINADEASRAQENIWQRGEGQVDASGQGNAPPLSSVAHCNGTNDEKGLEISENR